MDAVVQSMIASMVGRAKVVLIRVQTVRACSTVLLVVKSAEIRFATALFPKTQLSTSIVRQRQKKKRNDVLLNVAFTTQRAIKYVRKLLITH